MEVPDGNGGVECLGPGNPSVEIRGGDDEVGALEGTVGGVGISEQIQIEAPPGTEAPTNGGGGDCPPGSTVCASEEGKSPRQLAREKEAKIAAQRVAQKKKFDECVAAELRGPDGKGPSKQLRDLMNAKLTGWVENVGIGGLIGSAGGIIGAGLGALGGSFISLRDWQKELDKFNTEVFEPARQAAIEKCRSITGYSE